MVPRPQTRFKPPVCLKKTDEGDPGDRTDLRMHDRECASESDGRPSLTTLTLISLGSMRSMGSMGSVRWIRMNQQDEEDEAGSPRLSSAAPAGRRLRVLRVTLAAARAVSRTDSSDQNRTLGEVRLNSSSANQE
jgi:hypothetical protein